MEGEKLKLSNQALGTLMMSLQKCLMEQTDITNILKDLDFYVSSEDEIICYNPPAVEFNEEGALEEEGFYLEEDDSSIPIATENGSIPWDLNKEENLTPEEEEKTHQEYLEGWEFPTEEEDLP